MTITDFTNFFEKATGQTPFSFQRQFAEDTHSLVAVPTGLGKTAMAVVGWLWRRNGGDASLREQTPRRLVYCMPMRVLVEQTRESAQKWITNLGSASLLPATPPEVHVLMGGEDAAEWDLHPERDAILIGTQDMLLSRALNRGYAAGRARWPMQFGLLHTDCLWVFDEIQLMGSGLATTAQLEAFRRMLPAESVDPAQNEHGCRSVWMSATMRPEWLGTVDFDRFLSAGPSLTFDFAKEANAPGLDPKAKQVLDERWNAAKPVERAANAADQPAALAREIAERHAKCRGLTLVVVNTVRRACELFGQLGAQFASTPGGSKKKTKHREEAPASASPAPRLVLLHSRFRPKDREAKVKELLDAPPPEGTICISTQVVEAGVDVSATTLYTELAPWASLVQRFGRCNRFGKQNDTARVFWIDVPDDEAAPYGSDDLAKARRELEAIAKMPEPKRNVGLRWLPDVPLEHEHTHVIRRKDLIDLFDTTPDLAGNDIDIDRYVRETDETDVRVFWRDWERSNGREPPSSDEPAAQRNELCPAPIGEFKDFLKKRGKSSVYRWRFLDKTWEPLTEGMVAPGQVYIVHAEAGGYSPDCGWDPASTTAVTIPDAPGVGVAEPPDATEDERWSRIGVWQRIDGHTDDVCRELERILDGVGDSQGGVPEADELRVAARWHDWGKAHAVFQAALPAGVPPEPAHWAKANGSWKRYGRRHFRHELASALAVLRPDVPLPGGVDRNLVAYLIAAHHGKVRLSIRSLPTEQRAPDGKRFARGVWDGDELPATPLGGGVEARAVTLSLEPMELGLCEGKPLDLFKDQPSWVERMICLRDALGPFRLAYLEAILRAADMRASAAAACAATETEAPRA